MGLDLYQNSPAARRVFDLADAVLDRPLTPLLFEGPPESLQRTTNAQLAILAVSLAALSTFREVWNEAEDSAIPSPACTAGHSIGEYAALVAAGAIDEATAFRLVDVRARAMHAAGEDRPGSMVAVLGLERSCVEEACRRAREEVSNSYVGVANHNAPTQVVIAGDAEGLQVASRLCQEAGARRCVPLSVSAAFHSEAMSAAIGPLDEAVQNADLCAPEVPVVANVTAQPIHTADEIRSELSTQVAAPVLWADSVQWMVDHGVTAFLEFGAGQVLTNLVQRLEPKPAALAVSDTPSARKAVQWLRQTQ